MKKCIIFFSSCFFLLTALAQPVQMNAIVRDDNFKITQQLVELEDLIQTDAFEGNYFSIFLGRDSIPISFDASKDVLLKAATVYYHLTKARQFFLTTPHQAYIKNLKPLSIRIELTNDYDQLGLFANDSKNPQYNNALTVPPGKGFAPANIKPWDFQIWFRPSKKIHISEIKVIAKNSGSTKSALKQTRKDLHKSRLTSIINSLRSTDDGGSNSFDATSIVTSGVFELLYQTSPVLEKILTRKHYHLETALLPEVIYHEFCHVALSDCMPTTHSKAVIEGFADYFATRISNHHRIANKAKKYSTYKGKNAKNDAQYEATFEQPDFANGDFVLGVLWDIKKEFGETYTDELVLNACKLLNTSSDIRIDFTAALLDACDFDTTNAARNKLKLYQLFDKRGI